MSDAREPMTVDEMRRLHHQAHIDLAISLAGMALGAFTILRALFGWFA